MKNIFITFILFSFCKINLAQSVLPEAIRLGGTAMYQNVMSNPEKYRVEIIYTTVKNTSGNKESFTTYYFGCDSTNYFYPASLVKLPCSILSFEKLNQLGSDSEVHYLFCDSINSCQFKTDKDTTTIDHKPSVENYIKKMLLVSDNHAFGRIYEWLGPDYINKRLWALGFTTTRIVHRFDGKCKGAEQLIINPIRLLNKDSKLIESRNMLQSKINYLPPMGKQLVGKSHLNEKGKKIQTPKDFSNMNFLLLNDVHEMMMKIIKPEHYSKNNNFNLSSAQRSFLLEMMSTYPRNNKNPKYDSIKHPDNFKKYLVYGTQKYIQDDSIKIYNMVGQSHGFMADCAYIEDKKYNISFFVSARIYVNEDGIINDGKYEYKSIALPWFSELGRKILNYERKQKV